MTYATTVARAIDTSSIGPWLECVACTVSPPQSTFVELISRANSTGNATG